MDGASCPISVSKSVNKDGMMFFVNTNAAKRNAGKLIETAIGNAFLMDEKPDVTTLESWAAHCMRNVRAQSHKIDVATMQLSCSIVTGIRDEEVLMAQGPMFSNSVHLVEPVQKSFEKGPWESGNTSVYWRTPSRTRRLTNSSEWTAFKQSLFFTGRGGLSVRSDKEGALLEPNDKRSLPFVIFPWEISTTLVIASDQPASITQPTQDSTSGYKNYMRAQQYLYISDGKLGSSRGTNEYSYQVGTTISLTSYIPFYVEPILAYGRESNYTDGGRTQVTERVSTVASDTFRQKMTLNSPLYFKGSAKATGKPDSKDMEVKYIATAYNLIGEVYLSVLENGKDFTCAVTKPHDRPQVTITNPKALKPFTGKEVFRLGGSGAIRNA